MVAARRRSTSPTTSSLLDAEDTTLDLGGVQGLNRSIGLFRCFHRHETKATRLATVRVKHDLRLVDLVVWKMKFSKLRKGSW